MDIDIYSECDPSLVVMDGIIMAINDIIVDATTHIIIGYHDAAISALLMLA